MIHLNCGKGQGDATVSRGLAREVSGHDWEGTLFYMFPFPVPGDGSGADETVDRERTSPENMPITAP